jgi:hypothetical protein
MYTYYIYVVQPNNVTFPNSTVIYIYLRIHKNALTIKLSF